MSRRFVFIVNPRSANGATLRRFDSVRDRFRARLGAFDVKLTERPRHATELTRAAVRAGVDAVVAVGGDGTNNEVVNGFFDEHGERLESRTAMGVVTSGTGGDFRRTFGWSTDPLEDLERLATFRTRRVDVGRLRCVGLDGAPSLRHFINISSFGVSGRVVDIVNRSSKALGAKASFMLGSARAMASYKPQRVALSVDGGPARPIDVTLVAVANGQYFGGGMWVAPQAQPDDGQFDCVTIEGGGLAFWIQHGLKLYAGRHLSLPACTVTRCRVVEARPMDATEQVFIDLDGEQPGVLPARWEIAASSIDLLV